MAVEQCVAEIVRAAGRELTTAELDKLSDQVTRIVRKLDVEGQGEAFDVALMKAIKAETDFEKAAAIVVKRNAVKNRIAFLREMAWLKNNWSDDPGEGLQALLGGSVTGRRGAKDSISARQDALVDRYTGALGATLEQAGLFKIAMSGTLDDQIWKAMWHLNTPKPDETILRSLQPEAVTIARAYNDANEKARIDANHAGAWIKNLTGYVIKRTHSATRIAKAAGDTIPANDKKHMEAWREFISNRLNWEKSMPDVPPERRGEVLARIFTEFASGVHVKFNDAPTAGFQGIANIGKRMSQERVLHFKTPEAEFEYNQKFGSGTLAEGMFFGLEHMARDTELMRRLGPNAESNLNALVSQIEQAAVRAHDTAGLKKASDKAAYLKRVLWPMLTGEVNIASNATFARYSAMVRHIETTVDMGAAVLSAPSDLAFVGSALRQQGSSMLDGVTEAFGYLLKGKPSAERAAILAETGVWIDSMRAPMFNRYDPADGAPGFTAKMVQQVFKWNLLRGWTDRMRAGFTMSTAHRLANHADREFAALPQAMQHLLKQYRIDAAEWTVLRNAPQRHADGRAFVTPESAMEASDDLIRAYVGGEPSAPKPALDFRSAAQVEDSNGRKGPGFYAEFDNNKGGTGSIAVAVRNGEARVVYVENGILESGKSSGGAVVRAYEAAIAEARRRGLSFASDSSVTVEAARIYEALKRRGYAVERNPDAQIQKDAVTPRLITDDDSPVFRVTNGSTVVKSEPSALKMTRAREELADRMRAFFHDQATTAVIEPDKMTRAMLLQGQQPGTMLGESLRHFWMYKSFTASVMRRVLGREIWGYGEDRLPLGTALFNALKDPSSSGFVGMANIIAFSTLLGYGSMVLKDLAKGKEPRVPDNPEEFGKVLASAMAQGGGMGIYGDFLFGEAKSRFGQGALETFLGPTWRRFETIYGWKKAFMEGDKVAAKAMTDVLNNTPFINLFYTRAALDYLVLYRMQEWANPGYLRRLENRLSTEKDQEFVIPPSTVVPYGGF